MSYLEELLPEFRNGAKIRKKHWHEKVYLYYKDGLIYDYHNQVMYNFSAKSLSSDEWEFYKEPVDWQYIIDHKCLCWFWKEENESKFLGTLSYINPEMECKFVATGIHYFKHCRPVRKEEATFYEDKKDE